MNDFRVVGGDMFGGHATLRGRVRLESKRQGALVWAEQQVCVMPDTAYSRWVAAEYQDRLFGRLATVVVDRAVDRSYLDVGHSDFNGIYASNYYSPGKYLIFGTISFNLDPPEVAFLNVAGYAADGRVRDVSVPSYVYTKKIEKTFWMTTATITKPNDVVEWTPSVVEDRVE